MHSGDYERIVQRDASCLTDGPDLIMVFGTRNETIRNTHMVFTSVAILAASNIEAGSRIVGLDMGELKQRPLRHGKLSANTTIKDGFVVASKNIPALALVDMCNVSADLCDFEMFSEMMLSGIHNELAQRDIPAMKKAGKPVVGERWFDPAEYALRKLAVKRGLMIMQDQRRSAAVKQSLDGRLPPELIGIVNSFEMGTIVDLNNPIEEEKARPASREKETTKKQD